MSHQPDRVVTRLYGHFRQALLMRERAPRKPAATTVQRGIEPFDAIELEPSRVQADGNRSRW
jgi:hypothetical protein